MINKVKILGLLPILLLTSCNFYNYYTYDSEGYMPLDGKYEHFSNIKKLDLNWIGGLIYISQDIEEELTVNETSTDYHLYYKVSGDCLYIKYAQSGLPARIYNKLEKNIYITLPLVFDSLKVDAVYSSLSLSAVDVNTGNFNIVDGSIYAHYYQAKKTSLDLVSSFVSFAPINCLKDSEGNYLPHEIDIDGVQSNVTLNYFRKQGYIVDMDGIQCNFISDYNNALEYGNKLIKVDFDGVKSDLNMYEHYPESEEIEEEEQE